MPHILILECANQLQGESTTGSGTLEQLKNLLPTVESIEESTTGQNANIPTEEQQAVLDQANVIASMCENGFTCMSLTEATQDLADKVARV